MITARARRRLNKRAERNAVLPARACGAPSRGHGAGRRLQSPVGHSLRGKEWIQYDNPYDVGMSGLLGYGAPATTRLIRPTCCSCSAPTFPTTPSCAAPHGGKVDHDLARLGRRTPLDLAVHGDVGALPSVRAGRW